MPHRLPPLNSLRAFEAVARHLSFQKAAEELSVTPAAVSYQIRQLEDHLGHDLFHRMNRAIALTDAGKALYPGLRDGFARLHDAVSIVERFSEANTLVISVGPAFAAKCLAPRLWRFLERHPDIDARISANLRFSQFGPDGVDVAIRFGAGRYPGLYTEHLIGEEVLPLCSPTYAASHNLMEPEDLRGVTLIHDGSLEFCDGLPGYRDGIFDWDGWFKSVGIDGIDTSHGLCFNHADHALDAAVEGAGVVLGRKVLGGGDLRSGRLIAPVGGSAPLNLAFWFACPDGQETRPAVRAFKDWLSEEMQDFAAELAAL